MTRGGRNLVRLYLLATAALFGLAIAAAALYAPTEDTMGRVQKIFYIHLPAAINTFVAAFVVFVASVGYLASRRGRWDALAKAAAQVTLIYGTVMLATGMIWGRFAWGHWWTWSPRLTFSLVLWLLYATYLVIRPSLDPSKRALACAVYGVVAFLDVPLVYLSTKLLPEDIHPASVSLEPEMRHTLALWMLPMTMLCVGLIVALWKHVGAEAGEDVPGARSAGHV